MNKIKLRANRYKIPGKILFFISGIAATVWFLIRVIPKPSRASYPCVRAAAPLASSFVLYILSITTASVLFKKVRQNIGKSRFLTATFFGIGLFGMLALISVQNNPFAKAEDPAVITDRNQPLGEGKGIIPGRVIWAFDLDATNENCTNASDDLWSDDSNCDESVVEEMIEEGLMKLTEESSVADAWEALFRHFNTTHGFGDANYAAGEKIVIKLNLNQWNEGVVITSPQVTYIILDHLVNIVGVAQEDISIGDPSQHLQDVIYDKCIGDFPNVTYWTTEGSGTVDGRTAIVKSSSVLLNCSDGSTTSRIPQPYIEAKYMINLPVFKTHHRAGISTAAKNHFGSLTEGGSAFHLHGSLPSGDGDWSFSNITPNQYRIFVDIIGHEHLGGKTMLYLADGLWGSNNWDSPPHKFRNAPFNNDYPSSIFMSLDPVAIECVCFDFLYQEFDEDHYGFGNMGDEAYIYYPCADEFLRQAADPSKWPSDVIYDPEDDGSILSSLGVYEHWNNDNDKLYNGNKGLNGIQLVGVCDATGLIESVKEYGYTDMRLLKQNYPNPFSDFTTMYYEVEDPSKVAVNIYNTKGQLVKSFDEGMKAGGHYELTWDGTNNNGSRVSSGMYIYKLMLTENGKTTSATRKMTLTN